MVVNSPLLLVLQLHFRQIFDNIQLTVINRENQIIDPAKVKLVFSKPKSANSCSPEDLEIQKYQNLIRQIRGRELTYLEALDQFQSLLTFLAVSPIKLPPMEQNKLNTAFKERRNGYQKHQDRPDDRSFNLETINNQVYREIDRLNPVHRGSIREIDQLVLVPLFPVPSERSPK